MATSLTFAGLTTRRPTVAVLVDDTGLIPFNAGEQPIVAILGTGTGGEPKKPTLFASPAQAQELLQDGDLIRGVKLAFSQGAPLVYAVRVNPATKATATLSDATPTAVIALTSVNWGIGENVVGVKVETGSAAGKKVTVQKGSVSYAKDNIIKTAFSIVYTGTGSAAALTINGTTLTTTVTGDAPSNLTIPLATYPTVSALVDWINSQGNYTAVLLTPSPSDATVNGLDYVTAQAIKTTPFVVSSTVQAIVTFLNATPFVIATRATGVGTLPANTTGFVFLTGGTEGTTLDADWQAAIDALENIDVSLITPLSGDANIHAKLLTHVVSVSRDGQRPRRGVVGALLGEKTADLSNYLVRARGLNSDRVALVGQGVTVTENGVLFTLAPYFTAAMLSGMQAGVTQIGDSITNKGIGAADLEWKPTRGDSELLLAGGVVPIELDAIRGGFKVSRMISTWLQNDAYHRVEFASGIALDEVITRVINGMGIFLGQKSDQIVILRAVSQVETILKSLRNDRIIVEFGSVSGQIQVSGDTLAIQFEVLPSISINFIKVTLNAKAFTGTFAFTVQ